MTIFLTFPGSIAVPVEFLSVSKSSSSVLEVEVFGEPQITKNSLGCDETLLARLGDVLGEFFDDVRDVWS